VRQRDLEARWLEDTTATGSANPSQRDARFLGEILNHLSPTDRVLLTLRHLEGFSTAETADILEIPEGTVKSRLSAIRGRLQSLLKGEPHE
jgi:RNA polymerase sigma-70 factor (ECF subfamily)